jgi:hypothetical protein
MGPQRSTRPGDSGAYGDRASLFDLPPQSHEIQPLDRASSLPIKDLPWWDHHFLSSDDHWSSPLRSVWTAGRPEVELRAFNPRAPAAAAASCGGAAVLGAARQPSGDRHCPPQLVHPSPSLVGFRLPHPDLQGTHRSNTEVVSPSSSSRCDADQGSSPSTASSRVRFRFPCLIAEFWKGMPLPWWAVLLGLRSPFSVTCLISPFFVTAWVSGGKPLALSF